MLGDQVQGLTSATPVGPHLKVRHRTGPGLCAETRGLSLLRGIAAIGAHLVTMHVQHTLLLMAGVWAETFSSQIKNKDQRSW
jgi:hypothetical protein